MNEQPIRGESYSGLAGELKKPSPWLASEDVGLNVEKLATVLDVQLHRNVKFDQGRIEPKLGALKFKEFPKQMILNSTNRKMMVRLFGMNTELWRGKIVALYVDPEVKMAGQLVNGLRLRPAPPGSRPHAELKDLPASWGDWTDEERGANRAAAGLPALQAWWDTLGKDAKTRLKPKLDSEWKQQAERATA